MANKDKKQQAQQQQSQQLLTEKPEYVAYRLSKWEELKEKRREMLGDALGKSIEITLPDGTKKDGRAHETTPNDIAAQISAGLAQSAIVAKVDGQLWDMGRPLEGDCTLEILKFENNKEAQEVFWHSSSHVLGQAMERAFGCFLCKGPPLEDGGFYYEAYMSDRTVGESDYKVLEKLVGDVVKEKQPFERLLITKEDALELFKYNKFKTEILAEKVPEGGMCSVYRCGDLIDPCKGPHLINTGRVKAFAVTKNSSSYWRADSSKESLQRVYAIAFPDKKLLKEWQHIQEEAKKRDHRVIGKDQELWFFHHLSPGCVFMLPHGQRIFNGLQELIRTEYNRRGYQEVQTPNMFHSDLWKTSGHWDKYSDNMFLLNVDKEVHSLKPMNCPGHCLVFQHRLRSYRELPIRMADFGVLHRNELRGALGGMTRCRRFQQDDAHIFCREDQIMDEIVGCFEFMQQVYGTFGFKFELNLSTRPEEYLGEIETWDRAEQQLKDALNTFGHKWNINPGDGAFYGPKIDITIEDALKRKHQCATIQLDFQLPQRFNLQYTSDKIEASGPTDSRLERPVMVHRAILGSLERFMAILTEHTAGKWPFWISPRQAIVIPISNKFDDYAQQVRDTIHSNGFYCDVDLSAGTINKKVRNAQLSQYNYILVVGQAEQEKQSVNMRVRDKDGQLGELSIDEVVAMFQYIKRELSNEDPSDLFKKFHSNEKSNSSAVDAEVSVAALSIDA